MKQQQGTISRFMANAAASMRMAKPAPLEKLERSMRRTLNDALDAHDRLKNSPYAVTAEGAARYEKEMDALEHLISETRNKIEEKNGIVPTQRKFTGGTVLC